MKTTKKALLPILAGLLAAGIFVSCGDASDDGAKNTSAPDMGSDSAAVTAEPDPFEALDFGGETFRILVSGNDYDAQGSSIYAIRHDKEEAAGDVVKDAVYNRNVKVEEMLNITFEFTENLETYLEIPSTISTMITSGDDAYELIIHDLFPLATMSIDNYFMNAMNSEYIDFTQDYWYEDYMSSLTFGRDDVRYLLAGDYFLDILRTAHALYVNKDMFNSFYESADELYDLVFDGKWTQEKFLGYIKGIYLDLNGDGKKNKGDRFGYSHVNWWGPMIPWVIAGDMTFLTYEEDGAPKLALNNERSVLMLERLNQIFHNEDSGNYPNDVADCNNAFINGETLFAGYQRVRSLEIFRDMEADIGILPYPKLDEAQENYITSSHDTANVGVIPTTTTKFDMVGATLEVLARESAKSVMPAYYETALKVKYARDEESTQVLDLIRYNIGCVFPIAFGDYCKDVPLGKAFNAPLQGKKTDFVSNYVKYEEKAQAKLDELWDIFSEIEA